jgi:hypothetical protein
LVCWFSYAYTWCQACKYTVKIQVKTIYKDKTTTVNLLTDEQVAIIKENPELKKQITKLQKDSAALKQLQKEECFTLETLWPYCCAWLMDI